jgi:hypothetical protein
LYRCCDFDVGIVAGAGGTGGDGKGGLGHETVFFFIVFHINYCCKYIDDLL